MVQIARDYHQALGMFLQISSLLESRGIYDSGKSSPISSYSNIDWDQTVIDFEEFTICGEHQFNPQKYLYSIQWSSKVEVLKVDGKFDRYQSVVSVEFLKYTSPSVFKMECVTGAEVPTWRILTPFDEAFALLEQVASKRVAESLLAGDMDHIEHSVALDIINALLPLVGATKVTSDAPGPVTMPSPTNIPQIPTPAITPDPEAEPG